LKEKEYNLSSDILKINVLFKAADKKLLTKRSLPFIILLKDVRKDFPCRTKPLEES